ncbi:MAG TPA: DUF1036 domain-containing protein [Gemmatimonadaceae bacterium]|jgi:uncharacterized membrane protein
MKNLFLALSVAAALTTFAASSASAQLRICNNTSEHVSIAVAYSVDGVMTSRGWYNADAGECVTPVAGLLVRRYYYVHAESPNGKTWGDDYAICTRPTAYEVLANGDCSARGLDQKSFFLIDTEDHLSFTQSLTLRSEDRASSGVDGLRVDWRKSVLDTTTQVMTLRSALSYDTTLHLRCHTRSNDYTRRLDVPVPASGYAEVGYVQGWAGNFVSGEWCDVLSNGETVSRLTVPRA